MADRWQLWLDRKERVQVPRTLTQFTAWPGPQHPEDYSDDDETCEPHFNDPSSATEAEGEDDETKD